MIHYLKGDALEPQITSGIIVFPHITNDMGGWGKGYVLNISKKWREPELEYRESYGNGTLELGYTQFVKVEDNKYVVNMCAQHGYARYLRLPPIQYPMVAKCLSDIKDWTNPSLKYTFHMPRIGCGLAGGRWEIIEVLLLEYLGSFDIYVYDWR